MLWLGFSRTAPAVGHCSARCSWHDLLHHPFQPLLQRKLLKPRGGVLKWLSKNGAVAAENDGSGVDWGATCGHLRCFFEACLLRDYVLIACRQAWTVTRGSLGESPLGADLFSPTQLRSC